MVPEHIKHLCLEQAALWERAAREAENDIEKWHCREKANFYMDIALKGEIPESLMDRQRVLERRL